MRWLLTSLILTCGPLVRAQENDGAKLFQEFEKKLTAAKAYRVSFELEYEIQKTKLTDKGELLVARGNKLKGAVKGKEGARTVDMTFLSDGKTLVKTSLVEGTPLKSSRAASPQLGATVTGILTRMGMFQNIVNAQGALVAEKPEPSPDILKPTGFQVVGKEKVAGKEALVVAFTLDFGFGETGPRVDCKVWFDAGTRMPLKRTMELRVQGQLALSGVETYSRWEIDPEVNAELFTVPR